VRKEAHTHCSGGIFGRSSTWSPHDVNVRPVSMLAVILIVVSRPKCDAIACSQYAKGSASKID
jgi:hypothetical protein